MKSIPIALCSVLFAANASQGQTVRDGMLVPAAAVNLPGVRTAIAPSERSPSSAHINFDEDAAPCLFVDTTALRDKYQYLGVHFRGPASLDGGAILANCDGFFVDGYSDPNLLGFNTRAHLSDGGVPAPPEEILFDSALREISMGVGSFTSAGELLFLAAFDAAGNLVDHDAVVLASDVKRVTVAGDGIVRVSIVTTANVFIVDDLDFRYQCSGDAGYTVTIPASVPTGTFFSMCAKVPTASQVYLFISAGQGPTVTPYGLLCLDFPPLAFFTFQIPFPGERCFNPYLPCDDSLVGATGYFQFLAFDLSNGAAGISNQASLTVTDGGC